MSKDKNPLGLEQHPEDQDYSLQATSKMIAKDPQIKTPDFIRYSGAKQTQSTSNKDRKPTPSVSNATVKVTMGFNPKPKDNSKNGAAKH